MKWTAKTYEYFRGKKSRDSIKSSSVSANGAGGGGRVRWLMRNSSGIQAMSGMHLATSRLLRPHNAFQSPPFCAVPIEPPSTAAILSFPRQAQTTLPSAVSSAAAACPYIPTQYSPPSLPQLSSEVPLPTVTPLACQTTPLSCPAALWLVFNPMSSHSSPSPTRTLFTSIPPGSPASFPQPLTKPPSSSQPPRNDFYPPAPSANS